MFPDGIVTTDDPAAGAEIDITLNYDSEISVLKIPFVTDATVADRTVLLTFSIGTDVIYELPISSVITASTSATIYFGKSLPYSAVGDVRFLPAPSHFALPRGATIETTTTNLQSGDNFGKAIVFGYKRG